MTKKKEFTDLRKKIIEAYEENEYANLLSNRNRARSLSVGTAFGGIIEVSMRGDFHSLWCTLQPVEAVELIEQIAAGAGLEIAIRPRQDFATWRGWDTDADHKYWAGAAHWQVKQVEEKEAKRLDSSERSEMKALAAAEKEELSERIKNEYHNSIAEEIERKVTSVFEEVNEEIESLREEFGLETDSIVEKLSQIKDVDDEYDAKAKDETDKYYSKKIREKVSKNIS